VSDKIRVEQNSSGACRSIVGVEEANYKYNDLFEPATFECLSQRSSPNFTDAL